MYLGFDSVPQQMYCFSHTHTYYSASFHAVKRNRNVCLACVMRDKDIKWKPDENKMLEKNSSKNLREKNTSKLIF